MKMNFTLQIIKIYYWVLSFLKILALSFIIINVMDFIILLFQMPMEFT